MRAAQAVELALRESVPDAVVQNIDVLTLTNTPFRKLYGEAYLELVNEAPHVLGYMYDLLDRPRRANSRRDRLRGLVQRINLGKLSDLLQFQNWDVIVNTHFLPAEIIAELKRRRKIRTPQIVVTTDFETHRLWVHSPVEHYTTATDEGAEYLKHWGVDSQISVTGIPIHPNFSKSKDQNECLERHGQAHGFAVGPPTVLQLAGGFGVGPISTIFEQILSIEQPLQIFVVAGKNARAKTQLEGVKIPARHKASVIGFTTEIDELMAAADVVVSKPGGLTTSETLARGAAMAIVNPIPGQESRNSDYLLENGAAIKINNLGTLGYKLGGLLAGRSRLDAIRAAARRIARPRAAFDIAKLALQYACATS